VSGSRRAREQRPRGRNIVTFAQANGEARDRPFINDASARILELSEGTLSVREIAQTIEVENPQAGRDQALRLIEEMFAAGLLWLEDAQA
jgi:hypothetical protein